MGTTPSPTRLCQARPRRGGAYVVVLSTALIVALMGLGSILAGRVRLRTAQTGNDAAEARLYALSGTEAARLWIQQDNNWRVNYPGTRFGVDNSRPFGGGSFTVELEDPADGSLANRPNDTALLTATGVKGNARQLVQVRLQAKPTPLPALGFALHANGQIRVTSGGSLTASASAVSTNGNVQNSGTITGDVEIGASSITAAGTINGVLRTAVGAKQFPPRSVIDMYADLGTPINPGPLIENRVLAPRHNVWPGGGTNTDGVYVVRTTSDLTIRYSRIHGTLVVICPGRTVTIDGNVLLHAYRADYPVLIIDGNAVFQYDSSTSLQEPLLGVNYNPDTAPFPGYDDDGLLGDLLDSFPSDIEGLVHVTGTVTFRNSAKIKGLLLCESAAGTDAVRVEGTNSIEYDKNLFTNPPQGYAESIKMMVEPNSWKRVVR
jgi:hypothetical protein